ncbi:MAG: phage/plasmid primase, P4 family [Ignavibacteriaceae bacterium]|jgi:putative DNA primase/helicase|nr:phage/plasmid primase, P4 family [Ignavibacteriaceae bacterium]
MTKNYNNDFTINEYATSSVANRHLFESDDYQKELLYKSECYRSLYKYDESIVQYISNGGSNQPSIAGFKGKVWAYELVIDIDISEGEISSNIERARKTTIALATQLEATYGLAPSQIRYEFSGNKGFHLRIPGEKFGGFEPSENLPKYQKALCQKLTNGLEGVDLSIYKASGLMRIPNTKHSKSNLYSIPLVYDQIINLSIPQILDKAKKPNMDITPERLEEFEENEEMAFEYKNIIQTLNQDKYLADPSLKKETPKNTFPIQAWADLLESCSALSEIVKKGETGEEINNGERIFLGTISLRFGKEGRLKVHQILSKQKNYDTEKTDYHLRELAEKEYQPYLCNYICKNKCAQMQILKCNSPLSLIIKKKDVFYQSEALDEVIRTFKELLVFITNENCFYFYSNGVYSELIEYELGAMLNSFLDLHFLKTEVTAKRISDLILRLKMSSDIIYGEEFNPFPHMLNLKNGMYNIKTGYFSEHSSKYRSTVQLNIMYDPSATCELYNEKLEEIFDGDTDKIDYFLQWNLYCFLPTYQYQKFLILYGKGRNGKSLLMNVLTEMLGEHNCSSESLTDISSDKNYSVIHLKNKLVNISTELSTKEAETDFIKRLTGGDRLSSRQIYKGRVQFKNIARLIISTNSLPRVTNLDKAFLGRVEIIEFEKTFVDNPDTELDKKLFTEISGIFNLMVKKRGRIFKEDGSIRLQMPDSLKGTVKNFSHNFHSVTEFIAEECETLQRNSDGSDSAILLKTLYTNYSEWSKDSGYYPVGKKMFKEVLESNTDSIIRKLSYVKANNGALYKNQIWVIGMSLKESNAQTISCPGEIRNQLIENPALTLSFDEKKYLIDLHLSQRVEVEDDELCF